MTVYNPHIKRLIIYELTKGEGSFKNKVLQNIYTSFWFAVLLPKLSLEK